jgi:enoyl-CoA hydratase/carnithine racemase
MSGSTGAPGRGGRGGQSPPRSWGSPDPSRSTGAPPRGSPDPSGAGAAGPPVRVEVADGVATVTLDRPEAMNAISTELALALAAAVEPLATDRSVRAVVLAAAGQRAFCAGADLKQRAGFDDHGWFVQREAFRRGFAAVRRCPLPTVAAVFGFALGGGAELALSCDLVVAADDAVFGLPEVRLGLVPAGGGTQLLVRRVGRSVAKDLVLTGRRVDAVEARRLGLADRVVPRAELPAAARALAAGMAANSPTAVRLAKWAIDLGADLALEAGMEVEDQAWRRAILSDDRREGIAAFSERREPRWPPG